MDRSKVDTFLKDPKKALFILAGPIIVSTLVQTLYGIVDTAWVGRLGQEAIAALTFAFPLFFIIVAFSIGIGTGMNALISRHLGAGHKKAAENTAMHGLVASVIVSILTMAVGLVFLSPLLSLFGASADVLALSESYLRYILIASIFLFPSFIMNSIFVAQGDAKTAMKVQVGSLLLNMVLDPIFIYTFGLGVKGAAIATLISFAMGVVVYAYFIRTRSALHISRASFSFRLKIIVDILRIGLPQSFMMILISSYSIVLNRLMATFGTDYVAALGIVSRLESVSIMPVVALSIAMLTLVGMLYGARKLHLLREVAWYGMRIAVGFGIVVGGVFFLIPGFLTRIFTPDKALATLVVPYLRIMVLTFPVSGITIMTARIKQGLGRGFPGLIINLVRFILVGLPFAYYFVTVRGYGYTSIAWAMVIGGFTAVVVAVIWLAWRFNRIDAKPAMQEA